jgi:hypothetical protein
MNMKYLKIYEEYSNSNLLIIDIQKSFKKFFNDNYINALSKYCNQFQNVYQCWDNHVEGKNVDKDYLYDKDEEAQVDHHDLYEFPNQKDVIEKRYRYDVDVDFFKNLLDDKTYQTMKVKEKNKQLKRGEMFKTSKGTYLIFIGNNHNWFECPKKLYELFEELKGQNVTIVGGADSECLQDIYITAESMGLKIKRDWKYIYTATHCPIK